MAHAPLHKVLLLGATGMLGSAVYDGLKDRYSLIVTARTKEKIALLDKAYGYVHKHRVVEFDATNMYENFAAKKGAPSAYYSQFLAEVGDVDFVINAIGITIPSALDNAALTFFVNGALPHILARTFGSKLIHITTDCVYSGKEGFPYDENSPKTPPDIYGLAKSLGEPTTCLTLRTSIIGRELEGFTGLLEWFLQQNGKTIKGFTHHFWSGVTTHEFGHVCDRIMSDRKRFPDTGLCHVFSNSVSKYEMLCAFKEKFNINCEIVPDDANKINRTLSTIYDLNAKLAIPSFADMLAKM